MIAVIAGAIGGVLLLIVVIVAIWKSGCCSSAKREREKDNKIVLREFLLKEVEKCGGNTGYKAVSSFFPQQRRCHCQ